MRNRNRLTHWKSFSAIVRTRDRWYYTSEGYVQDIFAEEFTVQSAGGCYTGYEEMYDELGYSKSSPVSHWTYKLTDVSGVRVLTSTYYLYSFRITDTFIGDNLAFLVYFGFDPTSPPDGGEWEPFDLSKLILDPKAPSTGSFYGMEFAKDVVNLIVSAKRLKVQKTVKSALKVLSRLKLNPSSTIGAVRTALDKSSNGFLAWNFGFKPLVQDITELGAAYSKYTARQAVRKSRGAWQKVGAAYTTQYTVAETAPMPPEVYPGLFFPKREKVQISRQMAKVLVRTDQIQETFAGFLKQHLRIGDVVGLAWELTPFSFVADWFLHIDKRIQSAKTALLQSVSSPMLLRDRNISQKRSVVGRVVLNSRPNLTEHFPSEQHEICGYVYTTYLRNVPMNEGLSLISLTGFKTFQRQLSAALVWQWLSGKLGKQR